LADVLRKTVAGGYGSLRSQGRLVDASPEPVIGLAEGETQWRGMTVEREMGDEASDRRSPSRGA